MPRAGAEHPARDPVTDPPGGLAQAFAVVGGQAAWGLALLIAYPTVQVACEAGLPILVHLVRWIAGAVALGATVTGYRVYRGAQRLGPRDDDPRWRTRVERIRLVGLGGMLLSAFAVMLLVVEDMATWAIDPCL